MLFPIWIFDVVCLIIRVPIKADRNQVIRNIIFLISLVQLNLFFNDSSTRERMAMNIITAHVKYQAMIMLSLIHVDASK